MATERTINPPPLEVDIEIENDSSYGDELSGYSTSLTSSAIDYRHENGRRYHAYQDGSYLLPNDEEENDRLDMTHEMLLTLMHRKLFLAPIDNPQRVIDIGTGTGIWAVDFADEFQSAEVIGNDLSPIQPRFVPANLKFIVDDIEQPWGYENNPFDFIHARYLCGSIKDFPRLLRQCYECAKPGGWVEFQDWDPMPRSEDSTLEGTAVEEWYNRIIGAFEGADYVTRPGGYLESWFKEAGFVNIAVQRFRIPLGTWPKNRHMKKVGAWCLFQSEKAYEGSAMAILTRYENWKPEDVKKLCERAKVDSRKSGIHALFDFYVVYGQKPALK